MLKKEIEFKKIRLVFENCDHLDIDKENVSSICFDGIKDYGSTINGTNKMIFHKNCESVSIELKSDVEYIVFNKKNKLSNRTDIVWVILLDENDSELISIYVSWNLADDYDNSWQKNDIREDGRILISIMTESKWKEHEKM